MDSRKQTPWEQPPAHPSTNLPPLTVTWYACGPTVYDDAHLGHARNYVSTDILRRIMKDYFKFDVRFVMNITGVDDKTIIRGRQQHLLPTLAAQSEQVYVVVLRGGALDPEGKPGDAEANIQMHINTVVPAAKMIAEAARCFNAEPGSAALQGDITSDAFYHGTREKYEAHFMLDMRAPNVLDPDEITRVTEYGQGIADFVERVVANQFGYVTSVGSVYFDIQQFGQVGHHYARLEAWNRNEQPLQRDDEGALTKAVQKKSPDDFALWKAPRSGEPTWPSAWGPGRPGWHIECFAMASSRLGNNGLAQSEAYWSKNQQWVNYFFHIGHLSIQDSKMSKSLKEFHHSLRRSRSRRLVARGLKIVFLLGGWRDGVEISEELLHVPSTETSLSDALKMTPYNVMSAISDLVPVFNTQDNRTLEPTVVETVATWLTRIVTILALNGVTSPDDASIGCEGIDVPDAEKPFLYSLSTMRDSLRLAAKTETPITSDDFQRIPEEATFSKKILSLCDRLRDVDLFSLGIYLEDRDDTCLARGELVQQAKQKQQEKEKQEKLAREKLEKGSVNPQEMFKTNECSAWDEDGLPTKDAAGESDWDRQKKAHEARLAANT
ncbi:tRNA synthetases class I (C) catalytic domain-containing protein [Aspergillus undulatus]|uniref:tRNA synthetases class I (C) catalytic domain-containing protein n=1 Tax=Aspergillus undulatus TaxID=1810928 RepID=UPI003CCD3766